MRVVAPRMFDVRPNPRDGLKIHASLVGKSKGSRPALNSYRWFSTISLERRVIRHDELAYEECALTCFRQAIIERFNFIARSAKECKRNELVVAVAADQVSRGLCRTAWSLLEALKRDRWWGKASNPAAFFLVARKRRLTTRRDSLMVLSPSCERQSLTTGFLQRIPPAWAGGLRCLEWAR
jgi:hypothetical protein